MVKSLGQSRTVGLRLRGLGEDMELEIKFRWKLDGRMSRPGTVDIATRSSFNHGEAWIGLAGFSGRQ